MIINLTARGDIINIIPENIYQGSNKANMIYVIAPLPKNVSALIHFEIPQIHRITEEYLMNNSMDITDELNIWSIDINSVMTEYFGTVKYQVRFLSGDETIAVARGTFQVKEGVDIIFPDAPTIDIYEQILKKLGLIDANFVNGWLEAQGTRQYNSEYPYTNGTLVFGKDEEGNIEIYKSLKDNNKGNPLQNIDYWERISTFKEVGINANDIKKNANDIKELDTRVTQNRADIDINTPTIEDNTKRIEALEKTAGSGLDYIGVYPTKTTFPTQSELTQFVFDKRQRPAKAGDLVKFVLLVEGGTDRNYTITYNGLEWGVPIEELPLEPAGNDTLGSFQGTNNEDLNIKHNVVGGKIVDVLVKNTKDIPISIHTTLNTLESNQESIIKGDLAVGLAKKAEQDEQGNNIVDTYEKYGTSYTKAEADRKFLSSVLQNKYYYAKEGIVDDIPTIPDGKQFEVTTDGIGEYLLLNKFLQLDGVFNFTKENSDNSTFWIKVDKDCVLEFRLTTLADVEGVKKTFAVDLSGDIQFKANTLKSVEFATIYNALGNEEFKAENPAIYKKLEVITKDADAKVIGVYCNTEYASTFRFSTQNIDFNVNYINGKKKVVILASEWKDNGDGTFSVEIPPARHEQAPSNQYGLDLQFKNGANTVQRIAMTPQISDDGIIKITTYDAIECELLVWNAIANETKGRKELTNPTEIVDINYSQIGTILITQTNEPVNLTLPKPKNTALFYTIYVANAEGSTKKINVEGQDIEIDKGIQFKWVGKWQINETPDKTSEIYDNLNNQPLNDTLKEIPKKANKDGSNIQVEVWKNILGVDLKANNKSVELKEGLAVDNLIDFFRHFYDLRKGVDDTWEFEVGEGKNENIMNIFGFPYGESPTNSAELIVKRIATSGIGYTLELTFASKKSNTTHTAFVRGWIISGTSYDKYIHFTGWRNARGGQWVDEVNGEVTLIDTNELVLNIGEFKNPYNNCLIAEVTKNNHSYNAFLMLSITSQNVGETTIKLDNEDVYVKVDYNAKTFTISKTSSGSETLKVHLYEKLI